MNPTDADELPQDRDELPGSLHPADELLAALANFRAWVASTPGLRMVTDSPSWPTLGPCIEFIARTAKTLDECNQRNRQKGP